MRDLSEMNNKESLGGVPINMSDADKIVNKNVANALLNTFHCLLSFFSFVPFLLPPFFLSKLHALSSFSRHLVLL